MMSISESAIIMHLPAPLHLPIPSVIEKRKRRRESVCVCVCEQKNLAPGNRENSPRNTITCFFPLPSFAVTKASERARLLAK
jgi:hypothetical protein